MCDALAACHDVADEFGAFRTDLAEPDCLGLAEQLDCDVSEIGQLVFNLDLAHLGQRIHQGTKPEAIEINVGNAHARSFLWPAHRCLKNSAAFPVCPFPVNHAVAISPHRHSRCFSTSWTVVSRGTMIERLSMSANDCRPSRDGTPLPFMKSLTVFSR